MAEMPNRIEAKSRKQAMDWSLVLVSQDIENAIESGPDGATWALVVAEADYERAVEAVDLYQRENRHWAWRKQLLKGGLLFDWTSLLWVLLLVLFYAMADERPMLKERGLMNSVAVSHGEIWRLATAVWLHADLGHLASNAALGIVLLGLAMGRYGSGTALLAAYLAGLGGNVAVWLLALGHPSLGASGMVMGCLGLLAASTFRWDRRRRVPFKHAARGILAGILLFVLLGLSPETDFRAHIGGFVTGLGLGLVLNFWPKATRTGKMSLAAGILFTGLVIFPWAMTFKEVQ